MISPTVSPSLNHTGSRNSLLPSIRSSCHISLVSTSSHPSTYLFTLTRRRMVRGHRLASRHGFTGLCLRPAIRRSDRIEYGLVHHQRLAWNPSQHRHRDVRHRVEYGPGPQTAPPRRCDCHPSRLWLLCLPRCPLGHGSQVRLEDSLDGL